MAFPIEHDTMGQGKDESPVGCVVGPLLQGPNCIPWPKVVQECHGALSSQSGTTWSGCFE